MNCPCCGQELNHHDSFGKYLGNDKWDFSGDIYKCTNEECESEVFNYCFYNYSYRGDDTLQEGYPC